MTMPHLKLVPWESWHLWSQVYAGLFSSSPQAALNKVSAWRSRSSSPISVEITADLINIQRKDPYFSKIFNTENFVTADMLRLMYSMAIMRLVNGVVDQSKWQNSTSVAERAEAAGLPRMLVDIRHEVAHKELPSLPFLQLASKEALKWLKVHYWEAQQQALQDSSEYIKNKIYDYAYKEKLKGSRVDKHLENIIKLVSSAAPEVVNILVSEGLLERCIAGDKVWQTVIGELSSSVPQLLRELVSWCLKDRKQDLIGMQLLSFLLAHAPKKSWSHHARRLVEMSDAVLQLQKESDDSDPNDRNPNSSNSNQGEMANNSSSGDETINANLKDTEKEILEAGKNVQMLRKQRHGMVGEVNSLRSKGTSMGQMKWTVADEDWRPCAIGKLPDRIGNSGVIPLFGIMLPMTELGGETCETLYGGEVLNGASTETAPSNIMRVIDDDDNNNTVRRHDADTKAEAAEIAKSNLERRVEPEHEGETVIKKVEEEAGIEHTHMNVRSHSNGSSTQRGKKHTLSGTLLLDGVYKRCRIDQLNAIQSAIQLLK